jgi:hypothetical protein
VTILATLRCQLKFPRERCQHDVPIRCIQSANADPPLISENGTGG